MSLIPGSASVIRRSMSAIMLAMAIAIVPMSAEPAPARPRVALVLSGGSALGMAHAGVIEVIEKAGIPIDMVLGTSMGSIVGGLYSAGYSPSEMQDIVRNIDWTTLFSERRDNPGDRYDITKEARFPAHLGFDRSGLRLGAGLLKGQNVLTFLTGLTLDILAVRDFDALPVPFRSVAADILTGERVVFSSGGIPEAMRASMSIPGLFEPWDSGEHLLVDGGIVDNMPVDIARSMGADIVIAVESRTRGARSRDDLRSEVAVSAQTINLFIEENMRPARAGADIFIRPELQGFSTASYGQAAALILRGREAAEGKYPELQALARKIAESRPLVTPDTEPNRSVSREMPLLARLRVEGGSADDRAYVATIFDRLVGRRLDRATLTPAIDAAFGSGRFALVVFDLDEGSTPDGGVAGVVRLVPDKTTRNDVLLGGSYRGVLSSLPSTESVFKSAAYFGELSGKDSALFVEAGLLGLTRLRVEYFQPVGPLYVKPSLYWESRYDSWPVGEGLGIRSYFRRAGGGVDFGVNLGRRGEMEAGWSLESIKASSFEDRSLGLSQNSAIDGSSLGRVAARIDYSNYDRLPFPSRGFSVALSGRFADPVLGGDTSFTAADLEAGLALPFDRRTSLGLALFMGSDFSGFLPVQGALPSVRWYDLRRVGMFHDLEVHPDRETGNHVVGAGVELRRNIGRMSPLIGGSLFALLNVSVGGARATGDPSTDFLPLRWDGSLGLGTRFIDGLGALLTLGAIVDGNPQADWRPVLALEIGALSNFYEDRR